MKKSLLVLAAALLAVGSVQGAKPRPKLRAARQPVVTAVKPVIQTEFRRSPYVGAISYSVDSSTVLFSDNADRIAYPASVTKLMTAFLVLEDVKNGKYALDSRVEATAEVYNSEPSWVGLKVGEQMTVDHLLYALLVNSANDAAIALGVNSAGSLEAFVARMNACAAELGMRNTAYFNPNGLPPGFRPRSKTLYPWKEFNRTTAADQLKLAVELVKRHPEVFTYTSVKVRNVEDTPVRDGQGRPYPLKNHNHVMVLNKYKIVNPDGSEAVDGLKTGYINAGGSSVVLSGRRNGKHVIVVVLGSASSDERDENAARMMRDALDAIAW